MVFVLHRKAYGARALSESYMMVHVPPMQRLKAMLEGLGNGVKMEESYHIGVGAISGGRSE